MYWTDDMATDDVCLTSANTTLMMDITGKTRITFKIQGVSFVQNVYLIKDLACDI